MLIKTVSKLHLVCLENIGLIKAGFLKKILSDGFNGIVDLQTEEEFQKLMKFK